MFMHVVVSNECGSKGVDVRLCGGTPGRDARLIAFLRGNTPHRSSATYWCLPGTPQPHRPYRDSSRRPSSAPATCTARGPIVDPVCPFDSSGVRDRLNHGCFYVAERRRPSRLRWCPGMPEVAYTSTSRLSTGVGVVRAIRLCAGGGAVAADVHGPPVKVAVHCWPLSSPTLWHSMLPTAKVRYRGCPPCEDLLERAELVRFVAEFRYLCLVVVCGTAATSPQPPLHALWLKRLK
jgi:hypothetical protein